MENSNTKQLLSRYQNRKSCYKQRLNYIKLEIIVNNLLNEEDNDLLQKKIKLEFLVKKLNEKITSLLDKMRETQ